MAPKKKGSFLTRGRQRVQQTRQLKQAAARQLPPKGGSTAARPKAVGQRTATAVRQRVTQDVATLRALGDNMRRNQARAERQIPADKSPNVRRVGPGGANPRPQGKLPAGGSRPALPPGRPGGVLNTRGGGTVRPVAVRDLGSGKPNQLPTGAARPALPPGRSGGSLATTPKPSSPRRQLPPSSASSGAPRAGTSSQPFGTRALPPATPQPQPRLPGGTGGADRVTGSGVRTGRPGAARPALPPAGARPAATGGVPSGASLRAPINMGGLKGGLLGALGGAAAAYVGDKAGRALGGFLRENYDKPKDDKRPNRPGGSTRKPERPASNYENLYDTDGGRGNYGLERKPPAAATSSATSSSPSRASGGQSAGSTPATRSRPAARAQSGQSAASAPTSGPAREWKDFNPGRGTSKTTNPLLKNNEYLMSKMRQREQREQTNAIGPVKDGNTYAGNLKQPTGRGPVANAEEYGNMLKIDKLKKDKKK